MGQVACSDKDGGMTSDNPTKTPSQTFEEWAKSQFWDDGNAPFPTPLLQSAVKFLASAAFEAGATSQRREVEQLREALREASEEYVRFFELVKYENSDLAESAASRAATEGSRD